MTKKQKKTLAEMLKNQIEVTDKMFENREQEYAFIIGYLKGVIKITIDQLES
jgi:hypothetical protein